MKSIFITGGVVFAEHADDMMMLQSKLVKPVDEHQTLEMVEQMKKSPEVTLTEIEQEKHFVAKSHQRSLWPDLLQQRASGMEQTLQNKGSTESATKNKGSTESSVKGKNKKKKERNSGFPGMEPGGNCKDGYEKHDDECYPTCATMECPRDSSRATAMQHVRCEGENRTCDASQCCEKICGDFDCGDHSVTGKYDGQPKYNYATVIYFKRMEFNETQLKSLEDNGPNKDACCERCQDHCLSCSSGTCDSCVTGYNRTQEGCEKNN
jgi:hypothetical protein